MSPSIRAREDHAAFVAGSGGDLVRTAYAVCGDREQARRSVVAALVELRADWAELVQSGSPRAQALTATVRRILRDARHGRSAAAPFGTAAGFDPEWGSDDGTDELLLGGYAALSAPTRAALTLRVDLRLDWVTVGQVLALPVPQVRAVVDSALAELGTTRDEAADRAGTRRPTRPVAEHLAAVLDTALEDAGLPDDLTAEVDRVVRSGLVRRRTVVGALAAGLAAAAAGGTVLEERGRRRAAVLAARSGGPAALTPLHSLPGGLASWPARGTFTSQPRLLAAVGAAGPPPYAFDDSYGQMMGPRVLWADRIDGRAVAAVAYPFVHPTGTNITGLGMTYFRSPDDDPGRVVRDQGRPLFFPDDTALLGFATTANGGGSLVVLSAPDRASVSWSDTVDYDLEGHASRTDWRPLALSDGMVVVPLGTATGSVVRVRGAGHEARVVVLREEDATDEIPLGGLPTDTADPGEVTRRILAWTTSRAASVTGLAPHHVTTSVLSTTDSDHDPTGLLGRDTTRTRVLVLLTELPWGSWGAVLRSVVAYPVTTSRTVSARPVELLIPLAAATARHEPVIVRTRSASDGSTSLLVLAPGATMVTIAATGLDVSQPVVAGSASLELRSLLERGTVTTRDADLRVTGQWSWPPAGARDPYAMLQPPRF